MLELVLELLVLELVPELVLEPDGQITGNTSTRGGRGGQMNTSAFDRLLL